MRRNQKSIYRANPSTPRKRSTFDILRFRRGSLNEDARQFVIRAGKIYPSAAVGSPRRKYWISPRFLGYENGMFDHISISVRDLPRSLAFYDAVLASLGFVRLFDNHKSAGWGTPRGHAEAPFAIVQVPPGSPTGSTEMGHIAFRAPSREAVVAFFEAAAANGAEAQGAPRIVAEYGPHYFAAFVGDPDGYNLEAVCHSPEE